MSIFKSSVEHPSSSSVRTGSIGNKTRGRCLTRIFTPITAHTHWVLLCHALPLTLFNLYKNSHRLLFYCSHFKDEKI